MKVVVTGGCGFLGTNLCLFYRKKGAEVIAIDNLTKHEFSRNIYMKPEARNFNRSILEKSGVKIVVMDISNEEVLIKYGIDADYICHTAAQAAMTISWEDPRLDFNTNTLGTFNVLEAGRKYKIPVAICSSIHTYGPEKINSELKEEKTRYINENISINEDYPLLQGVITPLHASKRANEIYAQSYIDTFNMKVACFRLSGIYGPYQFGGEDHGWVANFSIRTLIGEELNIFGNGKQLRDILHVQDVCEAFDAFYKKQVPGIYTLGGGQKTMISLIECIDKIKEITQNTPKINFKGDRFGDLRYFVADYTKFNKATDWTPKIMPQEGITKLIEWVKENDKLFIKK